jgi:cytochrome c biogenesis protein CcmG/thiol:disulfide interchange protein DsbE
VVWRRAIGSLAFLALLAGSWTLVRRPPALPERSPLPNAPAFVLETLDGRGELALSELRGKPVVLNFWASWCAPCRLEMPVLVDAWRRYGERVHFLGVNVLDQREAAVRFARDVGMEFPSVHDPEGDVLRWFRVVGLPTTVFVTREGRISEVHAGPFVGPEGSRALERRIQTLEAR